MKKTTLALVLTVFAATSSFSAFSRTDGPQGRHPSSSGNRSMAVRVDQEDTAAAAAIPRQSVFAAMIIACTIGMRAACRHRRPESIGPISTAIMC